MDGQTWHVDLREHWTGKINHAPAARCNVRFEGVTLVPTRTVTFASKVSHLYRLEPLAVDYGIDYWVYHISEVQLDEWRARSALVTAFIHMHIKQRKITADCWLPV